MIRLAISQKEATVTIVMNNWLWTPKKVYQNLSVSAVPSGSATTSIMWILSQAKLVLAAGPVELLIAFGTPISERT